MITKHEMDMILAVVRDYVKSLMGRYTPSEAVLANFEEEHMSFYSGYTKVNQDTIRELVRAVKQAFAALPTPTSAPEELKYANGNSVFEVLGNELIVKNHLGLACFSVDENGLHVIEDIEIRGNMKLSNIALSKIQIDLTQQDLDDLWT